MNTRLAALQQPGGIVVAALMLVGSGACRKTPSLGVVVAAAPDAAGGAALPVAPAVPVATARLEGYPTFPFEARTRQATSLFPAPDLDEPDDPTPADVVLTVVASGPAVTWFGTKGAFVRVLRSPQHVAFAFLPHLEALRAGDVMPAEAAGRLLFAEVAESERGACLGQVQRQLVPGASGKRLLLYSIATDEPCAGRVAILDGAGSAARVVASVRRSAIRSLAVHAAPDGGAPLLDVTEYLTQADLSGWRRVFLAGGGTALRELLAIDESNTRGDGETRRSLTRTVTVAAAGKTLEIRAHRREMMVSTEQRAIARVKEADERWIYEAGALHPAKMP